MNARSLIPSTETRAIQSLIQDDDAGATARHHACTLRSVFQPIVSLSHCRSVGYEALVRATHPDGTAISPAELFARVGSEAELVHLDRLCRALHVQNFTQASDANTWLFLNVHPTVSVRGRHYGGFFEELLDRTGLPPERVVIEILEDAILDDHQLADAVAFYRDRGCLVALDDFGIGHSNFGRIWQVKPHIVKLDRSTLVFARQDAAARRVLPGLVKLLHEAGSLVLIEGIEDEFEAQLAMESGADLAQGYFFARPSPMPTTLDASSSPLQRMIEDYRTQLLRHNRKGEYPREALALQRAATEVAESNSLHCPAVESLLRMDFAERCYLIDREGRQIGDSLVAPGKELIGDKRFQPLSQADKALWIRRAYWRNALNKPGEVQTTRPYLSVATGRLCVTLSICIERGAPATVLCLDLEYDDASPVLE